MKYIKFTQISADTGVSWAIAQPVSGPSYPAFAGLNLITQLRQDPLYYIGSVDNGVAANPSNYVFDLTTEQLSAELKAHVDVYVNDVVNTIYTEENQLRNQVFNKYHDTASIAGIYKYQQALELLADPLAPAADVRAEATNRGVDLVELAGRIKTNHESFRAKETKIAGIRGQLLDRVQSFIFDVADPIASFNEFFSTEVIGQITRKEFDPETMQMVDKLVDVTVGKYVPSLSTRYEYAV